MLLGDIGITQFFKSVPMRIYCSPSAPVRMLFWLLRQEQTSIVPLIRAKPGNQNRHGMADPCRRDFANLLFALIRGRHWKDLVAVTKAGCHRFATSPMAVASLIFITQCGERLPTFSWIVCGPVLTAERPGKDRWMWNSQFLAMPRMRLEEVQLSGGAPFNLQMGSW